MKALKIILVLVIVSFHISSADDLILSDSLTLSADTTFNSVIIQDGGCLTADAIINVIGDLTIDSGGVITHSDRLLAGLVLNVGGTLEIESGGSINVDGMGLKGGGNGSVFGSLIGETFDSTGSIVEGAYVDAGNFRSAAASYGGVGAYSSSSAGTNELYGLLEYPVFLGSGGSGSYYAANYYNGGDGGGRITIVASILVIDGEISASANGDIVYDHGGRGSGGSIFIESGNISGSGVIRANGGFATYYARGGGGGRVALYYSDISLPVTNISAYGGTHGTESMRGGAGTIYLKDSSEAKGEVIVCNDISIFYCSYHSSYLLTNESSFRRVLVRNGGWLSNDSAIVTDTLWIDRGRFDVVNDYDIGSTPLLLTLNGEVNIIENSYLRVIDFDETEFQSGIISVEAGCDLDILSDSMVIPNDIEIDLADSSLISNDSTLTQARIAGVLKSDIPLSVLGNMLIENGGVVTHSERHLPGLNLNVIGTLAIESGGSINVDGMGLKGGGNGSVFGSLIGETFDSTGAVVEGAWVEDGDFYYICYNNGWGGSYGGFGGSGLSADCSAGTNELYGLLEYPVFLGSGGSGSYYAANYYNGGDGGGRIRIQATYLIVDGEISAKGGYSYQEGSRGGGGSGGSILIEVEDLTGSGIINVSGASTSYVGFGGGGGRAALYYSDMSLPIANISVSGGAHPGTIARSGGCGTIYLKDSSEIYGKIILDNGGIISNHGASLLTELNSLRMVEVRNQGVLEIDRELHIDSILNVHSGGGIQRR